jgi:L-lactate dehydrogenase complex protein LldG
VYRFKGRSDALDFVLSFLQQEGKASTAVWSDGPFLSGMNKAELNRKVPGLDFTVSRQAAADSLVGISEMDWALADTGSLVADQTAVEQRLASTLPQVHIAIIGTDRILPDKVAMLGKIDPRSSRYIAFITGPSRTADIERVLTIGVHGPKRLVIVFVDEAGGDAQ